MLISEAIVKLEEFQAKYGDLPVYCLDDGCSELEEIQRWPTPESNRMPPVCCAMRLAYNKAKHGK